ncbi:MAG TPA: hypothetical protein VH120_02435 [Gemmataceae bacterium]|jgi:hypothetical protein|nr:hypothetical protein [Gemmataceae bacterium]
MANSQTAGWTIQGFGAAFSLLNWVYVYLSFRTGRSHSLIRLIGGVCLLIGALLVTSLRAFAWVAVFADAGTIVVFLAVPLPDERRRVLCNWTQVTRGYIAQHVPVRRLPHRRGDQGPE